MRKPVLKGWLLLPAFLTACVAASVPLASETPSDAAMPSTVPTPTVDWPTTNSLIIRVTYPIETTELENGQNVRFMIAVDDAAGRPVSAAQVSVQVRTVDGQVLATLAATPYTEDVYRTEAWAVPRRAPAGLVRAEARAITAGGESIGTGVFQVKPATSEVLLNKYGFWLDAPTLRGISPMLAAEKGDARNGLIRWGGILPAGHILPANWIDLHWRTGEFDLGDAAAVRRFMLEELGDLAFTPVRELGPFEQIQFGQWPAWKVGARGQTRQDSMEWVVFYAQEDGRTFALGTTVVAPPAGIDAHARLRAGFAVFPELHTSGAAPEPLVRLAPAPEMTSPPLGADFEGLAQPILLEWQPARPLAADEYFELTVDYDYRETNTAAKFATRATRFVMPEELYRTPNCRVFNWQVTVMRQTGVDSHGQPAGVPVSFASLYRYLRWFYPPGEAAPFVLVCPNALY